jgi:hypothetical protein
MSNLTVNTVVDTLMQATTKAAMQSALFGSVNAQTGTAYTLALTDAGGVVTMSSSSNSTVTIPLNATVAFPIGTAVIVQRIGTNVVNLAIASGGTLQTGIGTSLQAQYAMFEVIKTGTDTWVLHGYFAPSSPGPIGGTQASTILGTTITAATAFKTSSNTASITNGGGIISFDSGNIYSDGNGNVGANSLTANTNLTVTGNITAANLPTSDPGVTGELWSNGGTVMISNG